MISRLFRILALVALAAMPLRGLEYVLVDDVVDSNGQIPFFDGTNFKLLDPPGFAALLNVAADGTLSWAAAASASVSQLDAPDGDPTGAVSVDNDGVTSVSGALNVTGLLTLDPAQAFGATTGLAFGGGSYIREASAGVVGYSATAHQITGLVGINAAPLDYRLRIEGQKQLGLIGGNAGQLYIKAGDSSWVAEIELDTGGANEDWLISVNGTTGFFGIANRDIGGAAYLEMSTGQVRIPRDNIPLAIGAAYDATITYDGTNLVIDPDAVGSGILSVTGRETITGVPTAASVAGASVSINPATATAGYYGLSVGVGGTSKFSVTAAEGNTAIAGNLGVGKAPHATYMLDVSGAGTSIVSQLANTDDGNVIFYMTGGTGGTQEWGALGYDHSNDLVKLVHGISFAASTNGIVIDASGNVGIKGVPTDTLDVTGTFGVSSNATIGGTLGVAGALTASGNIFMPNNNGLIIKDAGGTYKDMLLVDSSNQLILGGNQNPNFERLILKIGGITPLTIQKTGLATITGVPTAASPAGASLSVNPATATAGYYGLSVGVGDTSKFSVTAAEGNVVAAGTLSVGNTVVIKDGAAGVWTPSASADDLIIESSTAGGIAVGVPDAYEANIRFGTPSRASAARVSWDFTTAAMTIGTAQTGASVVLVSGNGATAVTIDSSQNVGMATNATIGGTLDVGTSITAGEMSSDPADPAEGHHVTWQSDGTGAGDDGDIMMKITAGGVTKTVTIVDFSAF